MSITREFLEGLSLQEIESLTLATRDLLAWSIDASGAYREQYRSLLREERALFRRELSAMRCLETKDFKRVLDSMSASQACHACQESTDLDLDLDLDYYRKSCPVGIKIDFKEGMERRREEARVFRALLPRSLP